jgi:hypothetical protein
MLNDKTKKKKNKKINKKTQLIRLTFQIHDKSHETEITIKKTNHNKL